MKKPLLIGALAGIIGGLGNFVLGISEGSGALVAVMVLFANPGGSGVLVVLVVSGAAGLLLGGLSDMWLRKSAPTVEAGVRGAVVFINSAIGGWLAGELADLLIVVI